MWEPDRRIDTPVYGTVHLGFWPFNKVTLVANDAVEKKRISKGGREHRPEGPQFDMACTGSHITFSVTPRTLSPCEHPLSP
jgi:hypothetical protein